MSTAIATERARPDRRLEPRLVSSRDVLHVGREDIRFNTPRPGLLSVEVTVHNISDERAASSFAVLRAAPLGAFVPWQPLGVMDVPAVEPGDSAVARTEVRYRPAKALAGADKLPPRNFLTALGLDDSDQSGGRTGLPADPLALVGRGSPHWAGNLNIFFPGKDVERHVAQALRIYPGRVNMAMFVVGDRRPDSYRLRLDGDGAEWGARVVDMAAENFLAALDGKGAGIDPGTWFHPSTSMLMLVLEPPADAIAGAVNVHVEQQSTGREAVVEFSLDANAARPGCYVV